MGEPGRILLLLDRVFLGLQFFGHAQIARLGRFSDHHRFFLSQNTFLRCHFTLPLLSAFAMGTSTLPPWAAITADP